MKNLKGCRNDRVNGSLKYFTLVWIFVLIQVKVILLKHILICLSYYLNYCICNTFINII